MEIKFKKLEIVNFKGTRNRVIEFSENVTLIQGRNKVGKTTVADACWWVLFGKDSQGNTNFGIKTNGEDMKPIPRIDHIVTLTMTVDGSEIILQRQYVEDWTKRRGADEELTGHHMVSCINGSRVKESEYKEYIDSLCNESLFKVLSKSEVFFTLKPEAQRALLIKMVGEKTPEQFVAEHPEFDCVLKAMGVLDFDTYLNGISYKIKEIEKMISDTDSRIKEQSSEIFEMKGKFDGVEIRKKIADIDNEISKMQEALANPKEAEKEKADKIAELTSKIENIRRQRDLVEAEVHSEILKLSSKHAEDVTKAMALATEKRERVEAYISKKKNDIVGDVITLEKEVEGIKNDAQNTARVKNMERNNAIEAKRLEITNKENELEVISGKIKIEEEKILIIEGKVDEFHKRWSDNENLREEISTICPTCHQPLPQSRIDEIQEEVDKKYQENKKRMQEEAVGIKKDKEDAERRVAELKETEVKIKEDIDAMGYDMEKLNAIEVVSAESILKGNERYHSLSSRISIKRGMLVASESAMDRDEELENLRKEAEAYAERYMKMYNESIPTFEEMIRQSEKYALLSNDLAKVKAERDTITAEHGNENTISKIKEDIKEATNMRDYNVRMLGMEDVIKEKENRIKSLNDQYSKLQEQKANLQGERELAKDYQVAIIEDLEGRVNALFDGLKFRMFDQKLNGNVEPCCKCFIGVTEYKDGSHAERVNAGLEMIDTMAKYNDKFVPCFVDDAEGINRVYETKAQQIRMIVTMENEMQVIHM